MPYPLEEVTGLRADASLVRKYLRNIERHHTVRDPEVAGEKAYKRARRKPLDPKALKALRTTSELAQMCLGGLRKHNPENRRLGRTAAACVVIVRKGRVLAITRGNDTEDLALPGGHLEGEESFSDGALRELWEETKVDARAAHMVQVLHRVTPANESVTYAAFGDIVFPRLMYSSPFEGFVRWVKPQQMLTTSCTYRDLNRIAFERLGLI